MRGAPGVVKFLHHRPLMDVINVQCVSQQYWVLARMRCECGGCFHARSHHASRSARLIDLITAECRGCHRIRRVRFDASSFRASPYEALLRPLRLSPTTEEERQWLDHLSIVPMERTIAYVERLAAAGDDLALEYLVEVVSEARLGRPS